MDKKNLIRINERYRKRINDIEGRLGISDKRVHFSNVARNLLSVMDYTTQNLEMDGVMKTYEDAITALECYFGLLDEHPDIREIEFRTVEGYNPEISHNGAINYVDKLKEVLRGED